MGAVLPKGVFHLESLVPYSLDITAVQSESQPASCTAFYCLAAAKTSFAADTTYSEIKRGRIFLFFSFQ